VGVRVAELVEVDGSPSPAARPRSWAIWCLRGDGLATTASSHAARGHARARLMGRHGARWPASVSDRSSKTACGGIILHVREERAATWYARRAGADRAGRRPSPYSGRTCSEI
jgi:hypothetical protein